MQNGPIIIEKAGFSDLLVLQKLEKACFDKDAWPLFDLAGVLTLPRIIRLKAIVSCKMAGFIAGDADNQNIGWVSTIGVFPEYRRMGVGAALLKAFEADVSTPEIRLTVRQSNQPAIKMYEELGYSSIETWEAYYKDGEDGLVMRKLRAIT